MNLSFRKTGDAAADGGRRAILFGATGGIGRHVLRDLLDRNVSVTALVRSASRLETVDHPRLTIVELGPEGHLALDNQTFLGHLRGCEAVVQCLGHNMSFSGMFGHPRRLCTDTVRRVCEAARTGKFAQPVKLIVVNTEGVDRPDGGDSGLHRGCFERCLLGCLTCILPPHADNVATLRYLHQNALVNPHVSFCAVRPSDLTNVEP